MKKYLFLVLPGLVLLMVCGSAWGADPLTGSQESPAILAALNRSGPSNVTMLDDAAIAEIRGQAAPRYVLVKILGLNTLDYGPDVLWTWNPLGYRYGYFGGPNWSNVGETPVDPMDALFEGHDSGLISDSGLIVALESLRSQNSWWGRIYVSTPAGAPENVFVSGLSLIGSKFFFGWKPMNYSEYSRREAVYGMKALLLGQSILRIR